MNKAELKTTEEIKPDSLHTFGNSSFKVKPVKLRQLTFYSQLRMAYTRSFNESIKDVDFKLLNDTLNKISDHKTINDQISEILSSGKVNNIPLTDEQKDDYMKRLAANTEESNATDKEYYASPVIESLLNIRNEAYDCAMIDAISACNKKGEPLIMHIFPEILQPADDKSKLTDIDYTTEDIIPFAKAVVLDFFIRVALSKLRQTKK
jgi:hypothetical protein